MATLGETLRERRIQLGITLDQAEGGTRIRSRLLSALENGEYDRLPDPGYVRGYVSSYARYLELDPTALLAMYKAETGQKRSGDLNLPQIGEAVAPRGQQHAVPWRQAVAVVLVVALISLSIWALGRARSGPEPTLPEPVPASDSTAGTQTPTGEASQPASGGTEAREQTPDAADAPPFTVGVKVADDGASWILVTVDGKKAYEGVLTGGQSKSFEAVRRATVRIGRPSAVTVTKDGETVEIPSADTPTVELEAAQPE